MTRVLRSYLDELSIAGECAAEYLGLYQKLIKPAHWKVYLAARGVLPYIGNLITKVTAPHRAPEPLENILTKLIQVNPIEMEIEYCNIVKYLKIKRPFSSGADDAVLD